MTSVLLVAASLLAIVWVIYFVWRPAPSDRTPLEAKYKKRPTRAGVIGAGASMADAFASLTYGSPAVSTWKRACDESMTASRRRRGIQTED